MLGGVRVSLHPAGHILGSAQVRIEHGGEVWVVSGDYKLAPDPTCAPFEPVRCHTFVTESTFGLPIFRWPPKAEVLAEINAWWRANQQAGKASVLFAYPLGKAQRVLAGVDASIGPIHAHGAVERFSRDLPRRGHRAAADEHAAPPGRLAPRPDSGAAIGAGLAVAAPLRQRFHGVGFRLDAHPRHAAAALARPRLRALRSCRLARAAARDRCNAAPSASG